MYGLRRLYNQKLLKITEMPITNNNLVLCVSTITSGLLSRFSTASSTLQSSPLYANRQYCPPGGVSHFQRKFFSKNMPSAGEEFRNLDYNQLIELRNKEKNVLIDVREKKELDETGVLPGAYHIPLGDLAQALTIPDEEFKKTYNFSKPLPDDEVIFSCRSGKRSLVALEKALASGYKNAKHYKGGWLDWEKNTSETK